MLTLLHDIISRLKPEPVDPAIKSLVERAVERIDPRLKSFSNYPKVYIPAVSAASNYAKQLVAQLPGCIVLSPGGYAQDPLLHALFTDVGSIHSSVHESSAISEYAQQQALPLEGEVFALMGMRRQEKTVFGAQLKGDVLQNDVRQTLVSFYSHTLILPCADEAEFRRKLEQHFFDSLINSFSEVIAVGITKLRALEAERDVLASRLRGHPPHSEAMEAELESVRRQLDEANDDYGLKHYHLIFEAFMDVATQYLRLEQVEMPIDMRGVMRESDERLAGKFVMHDLIGRDRRNWTLWPVRLPLQELREDMVRASEKERWMVI